MSGKYALIIGNTKYTDPGLAQLTAPSKDAEDFARVLKDQDIGAFDNVNILVNETSASVIEVIDEFFDQKKPDDMLVLYFSGHGIRDEIGSLYLAFKNTIRSRLRSTAIKSDYIKEAMDQSRSKRQVLILDCCNSGAFPQGTKAELGGAMGMTKAFQGYGRFVLTASDATQFAWEGDKVIGETDNSLFTHFLVKGLEGEADSDGDGRITVDELYDYAYDQISRVTPKQTPTKSSSKQEGEIVLRQSTRIEDIKLVALPDDLISEIEDLRPYVREAAVQKLEKILKGKNIGMARSAIEALENIVADENTTRRVALLATQILEPIRKKELQEELKVERMAKGIVRSTSQIAQHAIDSINDKEKFLAAEKAESERKAKEEAKRLLQAQAEREAAEREVQLKAEREAAELAARKVPEKAAAIEEVKKEAGPIGVVDSTFKEGLTQIPLAIFLITVGLTNLISISIPNVLIAIIALLSCAFIIFRRRFLANRIFIYGLSAYLILISLSAFIYFSILGTLASIIAILVGGFLLWSIFTPQNSKYNSAPYASIMFGLSLFLTALSGFGIYLPFSNVWFPVLGLIITFLILKGK